jgi:hypothetical protein
MTRNRIYSLSEREEMRAMKAAGVSRKEIALEFGCSVYTVDYHTCPATNEARRRDSRMRNAMKAA